MEFLSQTYIALRGPTGAPQLPSDTIARLSDRLNPSTLLADRRAAVQSLKGLSRDCKAEVGERALQGLVEVLLNDAEVDAETGKAVLETLILLCDTGEESHHAPANAPHQQSNLKELGFKHTDIVLSNDRVVHKLLYLLTDHSFYLRLSILQFLITLLQNRRQVVQSYFVNMKTPGGPTVVVSILDERREMIRNGRFLFPRTGVGSLLTRMLPEGITLIQSLIHQSPDIQKILAFEGIFEKLFNIISAEHGLEGGTVVHDVLSVVDTLLRFNSSNQVLYLLRFRSNCY